MVNVLWLFCVSTKQSLDVVDMGEQATLTAGGRGAPDADTHQHATLVSRACVMYFCGGALCSRNVRDLTG